MRGRILLGLLFVLIGLAWLLDVYGYTVFPGGLSVWWPSILVVVGLAKLAASPRWWGGPVGLIVAGGVLQAWRLGYLPGLSWKVVAPIAIILAGLLILFAPRRWGDERAWEERWRRDTEPHRIEREDTVVFASGDRRAPAEEYKGGELTAVFGHLNADLREAKLPAEGAHLKATSVFGGVDIRVPAGWRVEVKGTPVFGKVQNRTTPGPGPTLQVEAVSVFGDVDVTN